MVDEMEKPSEQFFVGLCDNISTGLSTHFQSVLEILGFNDGLMIHDGVPTSVQLHLSLKSSQLQRTFMYLRSLVDELVRLTKLYSTSWEEKNQCLKALHRQYNIKQRKLDIALTKIELLTGRNKALEKIRIRHNWEKMFLKVSQTQGWRQVVDDYQQTISKGGDVTPFFKNLDSTKKHPQLTATISTMDKYTVNIDKMNKCYDNVYVDGSSLDEDLDYQSMLGTSEDADKGMFSSEDEEGREEEELRFLSTPHSAGHNKASRLSNVHLWITENKSRQGSTDEDGEVDNFRKIVTTSDASVQTTSKVTIDTGINTRTVSYDNLLDVYIRAPGMLLRQFPELCCSVVISGECDSRQLTRLPLVRDGEFAGFRYTKKLESASKYALQSRDILQSSIRVGFHPVEDEQMVAFLSSPLVELNVELVEDSLASKDGGNAKNLDLKEFTTESSNDNRNPQKNNCTLTNEFRAFSINNMDTSELPVKATVNQGEEFRINQLCDTTTIHCRIVQSVVPFTMDKSVETISLSEFVDDLVRAYRQAQLQRCRSACVETDEKPVYTELDLEAVRCGLTTELRQLKENYEEQIQSLLDIHSVSINDFDEERVFASIATSPIHPNEGTNMFSSELHHDSLSDPKSSEQTINNLPASFQNQLSLSANKNNNNSSKKLKFSKQWGRNLPADFLTRLCQNREASQQYHQELKERTTISVTNELTKKLKAEKKIARPEKIIARNPDNDGGEKSSSVFARDLYLPALFMPLKVKKSKQRRFIGRSYLSNINNQQQHQLPLTPLQKIHLPPFEGTKVEQN